MRKITATLVAGAVALSLASWSLADWPGYRGIGTDGVATMANPPANLTADSLKQIWRVPVGESFGQIAVVADKAVVFVMRGADEFAVALDVKTGKELWATRIDKSIRDTSGGNGPRSTPKIDGQYVYVYSTYMKLACLELSNGHEVWSHDLVAQYAARTRADGVARWGSAASPVIVDDLVIVVGGGPGKGIMAFNKKSGNFAWGSTDEIFTQASPTVATIQGQKQVICFMASGLVSVEPTKGQLLWKFPHPIKTATAASAVVGGKDGDIVYCSTGYQVGAQACKISKTGNLWTAKPLWKTEGENMNLWSTPVYHDGFIYGLYGHNDNAGPLQCIDIETGQAKWSQRGFGSQGGITLLGDKLLVLNTKGDLVLVSAYPNAYRELGRAPEFKGKNWIAPAISDGLLFARSTTEAACFDLGTK